MIFYPDTVGVIAAEFQRYLQFTLGSPMSSSIIIGAQWFFLLYFIILTVVYLLLNVAALRGLWRYMQWHSCDHLPQTYSGLAPPVSILVPAYNEEATIVTSVYSLLQLTYPEYEIIVINDGSRDDTLAVLLGVRSRPAAQPGLAAPAYTNPQRDLSVGHASEPARCRQGKRRQGGRTQRWHQLLTLPAVLWRGCRFHFATRQPATRGASFS